MAEKCRFWFAIAITDDKFLMLTNVLVGVSIEAIGMGDVIYVWVEWMVEEISKRNKNGWFRDNMWVIKDPAGLQGESLYEISVCVFL